MLQLSQTRCTVHQTTTRTPPNRFGSNKREPFDPPQFVTLSETHESDVGDLEAAAGSETVGMEQTGNALETLVGLHAIVFNV